MIVETTEQNEIMRNSMLLHEKLRDLSKFTLVLVSPDIVVCISS